MFVSGNTIDETVAMINIILDKLKLYLEANFLHINVEKTKFIHFKTPRQKIKLEKTPVKIKFGNKLLKEVEDTKFLGVTIDHRMSWDKHIHIITNKVRNSIAQLYKMRKQIPVKLKTSVYNAIVNSQLSYAISVWGGCANGDKIKPLFILQKRALRNLFSIRRVSKHVRGHTKPIFQKLKILTVYNVYNYMTIMNLEKAIRNSEPASLCEILKLDPLNRRKTLFVPLFKRSCYQNSYCYQAPKLWNLLASSPNYSNNTTDAPTLLSMKSRLKSFLLTLQSYGDKYEWIKSNNSVECYLRSAKGDPYISCAKPAT